MAEQIRLVFGMTCEMIKQLPIHYFHFHYISECPIQDVRKDTLLL